jgi:hypothetical protein
LEVRDELLQNGFLDYLAEIIEDNIENLANVGMCLRLAAAFTVLEPLPPTKYVIFCPLFSKS